MAENPSEGFDRLLKRYQQQLEDLDLNLPVAEEMPPAGAQAPTAAPPEEPLAAPVEPIVEKIETSPPAPATPEPQYVAPEPAPEPVAPPPTAEVYKPEPDPTARESIVEPPPVEPQIAAEPEVLEPPPAPSEAQPPSPAPNRPEPARARLLVAAAVFIGAIIGIWSYKSVGRSTHQSFSISEGVRGLAWQDGRLFAGDVAGQTLIEFDEQGRKLSTESGISNSALAGLTWGDGTFWSTERDRSAIYQHEPGSGHSVRRIYATPGRKPMVLACDGENMWIGDAQAGQVYRYLIGHSLTGTSLTPLNQYPLPGAAPAGMYSSEGLLWVLDSQSKRLTRYKFDTAGLSAQDTADLAGTLKGSPAGMAVGPKAVWVLTENPGQLHKFEAGGIVWVSAKRQ